MPEEQEQQVTVQHVKIKSREEILADLRKLASHVSYALNGVWPQYDLWPDHIGDLCDQLRKQGDKKKEDGSA